MAEVSKNTKELIQKYQNWHQSLEQKNSNGVSTIHVDEVASKVASFYEKLRKVVDWKEEHLFKKIAIERVLKRRIFFNFNSLNQIKDKKIAESFICELIRGGYFPNDTIDESKIQEVQKIIDKYLFILQNEPHFKENKSIDFQKEILEIAACEIEETISVPIREKSLIDYMTTIMEKKIFMNQGVVVINGMNELEKNTQVYIAVHRALFKLDSPIISYHILKKRYPKWGNLSQSEIQEITVKIYSILKNIKNDLKHPLAEKFYKICEKIDTPYLILSDILSEDPTKAQETISNPENFENRIKEAYKKRSLNLRAKLNRAAVYSVSSIFISKILIALAIEVPFDKYITGEFNYFTLAISIAIPIFLMLVLVLTIRPLRKENLSRVIIETTKIAYKDESQIEKIYEIKKIKKRGFVINFLVNLFYSLSFIIAFGLIIWGLLKINFGILSIIIFLVFISLISFAGTKIRERAKELEVLEKKGTFFEFFTDLFGLPLIRMGKWLSNQWSKYNIIVFLLNSLIEMPFQVFVEFLEQWRYFLKEKKEEIH